MEIVLDRVYSLNEGFSRGALRVRPREFLDAPALLRGELSVGRPLVFLHSEGHKRVDFVGTEYAMLDLVSDRFVDLLSARGFTGWTTYPVRVLDKSGEEVPGYHGLSVLGRCGPLDPAKAERIVLPAPPGGKAMPGWRGFYFDPSSWDGRDFFVPEGTGHVFVTEAVKDALKKAKLSNIEFQRITESERLFP